MTIAELLRQQRERLALTQQMLAERAKLTIGTISRVENGAIAGATTKRKLAKALNLKLSDLAEANEA